MSNPGFLNRRNAVCRRRWSAPDEPLPHASSVSYGASNDGSGAVPVEPDLPPLARVRARAERPRIQVSRLFEQTNADEPGSPHSFLQTPIEYLPEPIFPIPSSPAPSYRSTVLQTLWPLGHHSNLVRGPSHTSTDSRGSLPSYDKIEAGPPTDRHGYYNYIPTGMEIQAEDEDSYDDSDDELYWVPAPFVTDPTMPRCPGLGDGSCPINEPQNSGPCFLEHRAPSALLSDILTEHGVDDLFEGSCPPLHIWEARMDLVSGSENQEGQDLLFWFRWWHCPAYRALVIAHRRPRFDISHSAIHARRLNHRRLQLQAGEADQDTPESYRPPPPSPTSPDRNESEAGIFQENIPDIVPRVHVDSTYFMLSTPPSTAMDYLRYGFALPAQAPRMAPPANLPPYSRCLSVFCPVRYPHAQGPFWDPRRPGSTPSSLIPGPNLASHQVALSENGVGDLFGPETSPPFFVLGAVERILKGRPHRGDVEIVERFRFFHCAGSRPIVMDDEEIKNHEEDADDIEGEEADLEDCGTPTSSCTSSEYRMDLHDFAQYFD